MFSDLVEVMETFKCLYYDVQVLEDSWCCMIIFSAGVHVLMLSFV